MFGAVSEAGHSKQFTPGLAFSAVQIESSIVLGLVEPLSQCGSDIYIRPVTWEEWIKLPIREA